ncbi:MAG: hypothetical protein NVS3B28_28770 [Candidatus Velthaea sp.]
MAMGCASRGVAGPLGLALCAVLTAAGPHSGDLAAIAAASGHAAGVHLHALATRVRDNRTSVDTLDVEGVRRLSRHCFADLCEGSWFDGHELEEFGINGAPYPQSPGNEPALRTYAAIVSTAFAEPDFRGTVVPIERESKVERFRVIAPQGAPLIAVADPASHRLTRVERADGTLFARLIASPAGRVLLYDEAHYDSVTAAREEIVPPPGPPATIDGAREVPIRSPLLPIVPCILEGRPANCLIDTGTTPSSMTLSFAEVLGREPRGEIHISALGDYTTGVVDAGPVGLGSATIGPLHFAVVHETRGLNFDIILGSDALGAVPLLIDSARHTVTTAPSVSSDAAAGSIPLSFVRGLPYVAARLGSAAMPLLFDTGDTGVLSIAYDTYRRNPDLFTARGNVRAYGLGGSMDAVSGELPEASIGPLALRNIPIRAIRGQFEGHAGYGLAARCRRLTIDFPQRRLTCATLSPLPRDFAR